ncbi:cytochrome c [Novosphingobium sp.]|uniref:c-type cytochrome n=1 Tax=Novosphingobium sp. TaxID=1874826 RepID=UPI0033426EDD
MIGRGVMVLALMLAGGAALAQAPAGTRISNATRGGMQDRSSHSPAEALFVEKCGMCHRQMGMGTVILARRMDPALAMLELRHDLTVDYVTAAARGGIGNMPRIQRGEVSDAQLRVIAGYLAKVAP